MKKKILRRDRPRVSRIDYIVFGNPSKVKSLVNSYGYESSASLEDLSDTVRELIRTEGRNAVAELVKLHPDREAILAAVGQGKNAEPVPAIIQPEAREPEKCERCSKLKTNEDNYCGCSHSYDSYDPHENLSALDMDKLLERYKTLNTQYNSEPENKNLGQEVTRTWNEIRQRGQPGAQKPATFTMTFKEALVILSLTMLVSVFIGLSFHGSRIAKQQA